MCNDYRLTGSLQEVRDAFAQAAIALGFAGDAAPNLEPREDIRPTDRAPIVRPAAAGPGAELAMMRWGFPPPAPKRPPVINFRSDGRTFREGRCLAPMNGFYEFTGQKYPKSKWLFTKAGEPLFCVAALWRSTEAGDAFTLLTMPPGPDIVDTHDRQIVVLGRQDWAAWLDPTTAMRAPAAPLPAGTLQRVQVR
jgi:putative SOS response-associated peptidase YedK